jgi:hypothetical protein
VGDGGIEVSGTEDVADDARNGDGEVVDSDASFSRCRRVQRRTLEVRIGLLVKFGFVFDASSDGLVGVESPELEIGNVALEEVAEVVGDAKTYIVHGDCQDSEE